MREVRDKAPPSPVVSEVLSRVSAVAKEDKLQHASGQNPLK
jgi:hypothetical protein